MKRESATPNPAVNRTVNELRLLVRFAGRLP